MSLLATPINGILLADSADPAGNNQDSVEILFITSAGETIHSGIFIQRHAGQRLRVHRSNPQSEATNYFEIASEDQRVVVWNA